jgi:hypothetical protein
MIVYYLKMQDNNHLKKCDTLAQQAGGNTMIKYRKQVYVMKNKIILV